jgi:acetyltransferase
MGIRAYPTIADVPDRVDLAVIVTPAATVPGVIAECVRAGVRSAVVISAGFKEQGAQGAVLELQLLDEVARGGIRVIGPNCLGVMNPLTGLNATFAANMAERGRVAFLSQSGALCTAILDWSLKEHVGFSGFISVGSMADVGWGDLIDYYADDPSTQSILIYMESVGDARAFLSAAREAALTKPIIVLKAGRTERAGKAAASHTGSLSGSDDVFDAALRRAGVLRVHNISDLFYMAEVLSKQPRPRGPRMSILTNAGGPGVLAVDSLIANGGTLAELSSETRTALDQVLPPIWSHNNPVDVLGDASPERFAKAMEVVLKDPDSDGVLVIVTPQDMTDPTRTAAEVQNVALGADKPILASWIGGDIVAAGERTLNAAGIPTFPYPDTAARAFGYMWRYTQNVRALYETPALRGDGIGEPAVDMASAIVDRARRAGRTLLTEYESKQLLQAYGIPTGAMTLVVTADEAIATAERIGYPVVLKLHSETITHKTDVGGVKLNLGSAEAVRAAFDGMRESVGAKANPSEFLGATVQPMIRMRDAYEIIVGSSIDPQFGPVLLFGSGGLLVEVYQDRALTLPPLNATLARRLMEQTRIYTALKGVRGRQAVDMDRLEDVMVLFARMVVEQRWVKEVDINPLLVSPDGVIALDARMLLHDARTTEEDLPRLAIRPYPQHLVHRWVARDGTELLIRPIRPEDEPLLVRFHEGLSEETVRYRYFATLKLSQRVTHERLSRVCFNDYDRQIALVAEHHGPNGSEIVGVGRLVKLRGGGVAELAVTIADAWQRKGIGRHLAEQAVEVARSERIAKVVAEILPSNQVMRRISTNLGFRTTSGPQDATIQMELMLERDQCEGR